VSGAIEVNVPRARAARIARTKGFPRRQVEAIEVGRHKTTRQQAGAWSDIHDPILLGGLVYMHGPRGVGKTFMACGLGIVWNEREHDYPSTGYARYTTAADFFGSLVSWQQDRPKNPYTDQPEPSPLEVVKDAGLLVIDELGEIKYSEFQTTTLSSLVDHRYTEHRPTLLISNQTPREIKRLGMSLSVLDRIRDGGGVVSCEGWKNMRGTQ